MDVPNKPECAWTRLYHPRGPQVTLPLPADPGAALAAVSAALDAGWLVQAPGLEEGEEKEQVGWVLKSVISSEGRETPFVLLYSANEALTWSFLKVYLNTEQDVAAFEYASKMKLSELPEYVGQDKPQRSASGRTDRYIVPAPRPFGVVFKKNPKHDNTEAGKMKPARLFVRWAEQRPAAEPGVSQADQDRLGRLMTDFEAATGKKVNDSRFLYWLGAASYDALSPDQYRKAVDDLERRIAAARQAQAAGKAVASS